jgi:peptidyl-prolyl cis-trans isomerase C
MKRTLACIGGVSLALISTTSFAQKAVQLPATPPPKEAKDPWGFIPKDVIELDGKKITKDEFLKEIGKNVPLQRLAAIPEAQKKSIIKQMIDGFIDQKLLGDLAVKAGFKPSKEIVIKAFDEFYNKLPAKQKEAFAKNLKQRMKKTVEEYKTEMSSNVDTQKYFAVQEWIKKEVKSKINVSDADIKASYDKNIDKYKTPEVLKTSHILVIPKKITSPDKKELTADEKDKIAQDKINGILSKLKKGADFAKLAKENSDCPSGKDGGTLPAFDPTGHIIGAPPNQRMDGVFAKAAAGVKKGEITGVVKTSFGYHIIKLNDRKSSEVIPLDKVKESIKDLLEGEQFKKELKATLDTERKKHDIKVLLK